MQDPPGAPGLLNHGGMHRPFALCLAAALGLPALALPERAEACGGCFAPTETVTTVNSHRMAVSLSPDRSILWDQLQYQGEPEDFVWVLPVPSPEVKIDVAESSFFDQLEARTAPRVTPRPGPGAGSPCFGCCASSSAASQPPPGDDDVVVYGEEVVGPYETVTIGSEDADALQDWLVEHGYRVTDAAVPTIMEYVEKESIFVVLRLAPDQGVQAMQPVRVTYPGFLANFPLEMVKVGARGKLDLTLWVFSEQRYQAANYENVTIDPKDLVYDWDQGRSNYQDVFRGTIDGAGGRAWVTEFAGPIERWWFGPDAADEVDQVYQDVPYPFLTRLRTSMRLDHIDEDVVLAPADDSSALSRDLTPGQEENRPWNDQDEGCSVESRPSAHVALIAFLLATCAFIWRPRRRRRVKERETPR